MDTEQTTETPAPPSRPISGLNFYGSILLKDWITDPQTGRAHRSIAGRISIIEQETLAGFKVKGNESNWVALVENTYETVAILGCQIRGFVRYDNIIDKVDFDSDTWVAG